MYLDTLADLAHKNDYQVGDLVNIVREQAFPVPAFVLKVSGDGYFQVKLDFSASLVAPEVIEQNKSLNNPQWYRWSSLVKRLV